MKQEKPFVKIFEYPLEAGVSLVQERFTSAAGFRNVWWLQDDESGEWYPLTDFCRLLGFNPSAIYARKEALVAGRLKPEDLFAPGGGDAHEYALVDTGWPAPLPVPRPPFLQAVLQFRGI